MFIVHGSLFVVKAELIRELSELENLEVSRIKTQNRCLLVFIRGSFEKTKPIIEGTELA